MPRSCVVTGAGQGIGRGIVERLLLDGWAVVALDLSAEGLAWVDGDAAAEAGTLAAVAGDAGDEQVTASAADAAERMAPLRGWVNNAAVFRDAALHDATAEEVLELVRANLAPSVAGSATAVRRFLAAGTPGSVVNVSSHQAQRPVAGALPYATAKAAVEGLTRAVAVDYGPDGIRANAVALGSVVTARHEQLLAASGADQARRVDEDLARLHPLGRASTVAEVAAVVAWLLGDDSGFVSGTVLPVDGGRAAKGQDPEERRVTGD